jgi:uncharacterized protein
VRRKKHLSRLRELLQRYQPVLFSERLAWSTHEAGFFRDLLPLPYTKETLALVAEHIDEVRTTLRRQMLLENPSTYLVFSESTYSETNFIGEVVQRTGCGLLLDMNNLFVATTNQQSNPFEYIDAYPLESVQEIHLAGHTPESGDYGESILIDTHNAPVVIHRTECSQAQDQLCVKDGSGRIHSEGSISATRLDLDYWMRSLPQPRSQRWLASW